MHPMMRKIESAANLRHISSLSFAPIEIPYDLSKRTMLDVKPMFRFEAGPGK
jgi:hypothetical protein